MITGYPSLYSLTPEGLYLFRRIMLGELEDNALDCDNPVYAKPVPKTKSFTTQPFDTAKEMAIAICDSLNGQSPQSLAGDIGLWAWLTFVLADELFVKKDGVRKVGEIHRWYPALPNDYQKAQRHLVRMPVLLYSALGKNADHLICGKIGVPGELREQLTSQQDMFSSNFQAACRTLYYDENTSTVKRGAASKNTAGVARRLAAVRKQLDVTWDMTDLSEQRILALLPFEFDRFLPKSVQL
jgi:hypothetical protein